MKFDSGSLCREQTMHALRDIILYINTCSSKNSFPSDIHFTSGVGTPEAVQVSVVFSPSYATTSGIGLIWGHTVMNSIERNIKIIRKKSFYVTLNRTLRDI